jgi:hypothetical protein
MTEVALALLQYGALGILCIILLYAYWKRDKQLYELVQRYTENMTKNNEATKRMNRELIGAINDLDAACNKCEYKAFVGRILANNGGE